MSYHSPLTYLPLALLRMFHLPVFQLDRHGPAENRQLHSHQALGFQDLFDFAFHAGKSSVFDFDPISAIEFRLTMGDARDLLPLPAEHALDFVVRHRRRSVAQTSPHEVSNPRGFPKKI